MLKIAIAAMCMSSLMLVQDSEKKQDDDKHFLDEVKCVMNAKGAAKEEHFVEYMDCKLYFCCGNCPQGFAKMIESKKEELAPKANHQLVQTKQFVQTGCPFSGAAVKEDALTKVGGVEVGFCCTNCRDKVAKTEDLAAKTKMVFNDKSFKKGFKKVETKKDKDAE